MISPILKIAILFFVLHLQIFHVSGLDNSQTGNATYYSSRFWGVKTTSGERYNPYQFTAAHRYFPLGSWVEVKFPKTNKSTIVRVNDRGPYRRGAIIDLSLAAAREIGLVPFGVSKVAIRLIPEIETRLTRAYTLLWLKKFSKRKRNEFEKNLGQNNFNSSISFSLFDTCIFNFGFSVPKSLR
jgi:rare lipoprotein A